MRFLLGTHQPNWLEETDVPLFISHRRLKRYKGALPRARGEWALDSGGFTELNTAPYTWRTTVEEYASAVERYREEIGGLLWAAPMDWMCEPKVLAKTGLSVRDHQDRTVANFLELRALPGGSIYAPVLQGQTLADYETCIGLYEDHGLNLWKEPIIGLGTVCRRQRSAEVATICSQLGATGLRLHGFGMKSRGVARVAHVMTSADSMAWSTRARFEWQHERRRLCGGEHKGGCANCHAWALLWRQRVIDGLGIFGHQEAL